MTPTYATSPDYLVPNRSSSGLITGYLRSRVPGDTLKPITDSSGLITGYSADTASSSPIPGSGSPYANPDDPLGLTDYNPITGKNRAGRTRGQQAVYDYQQRTGEATTVKDPAVEEQRSTLLGQEQQGTSQLIKSFQDYLTEAKQLQQTGAKTLDQNQAAYDKIPKQLQSELSDTVSQFANAGADVSRQYQSQTDALAKQYAADQSKLEGLNQTYEQNARDVAQRALDYATRQNNARFSTSGTPTSGSGFQSELAAKTFSDVMLPVEQQLSQNRIQQLQNYVTPQQRDIYAQNIQRMTGIDLPVAQALSSMGIQNANQVAQLSASLQGRSLQEQIQYLNSLGVPVQLAQNVLDALPRALTQLSQIGLNNNFYTLAQDYQPPLTGALPTYNPGVPNVGPNPYRKPAPYTPNPVVGPNLQGQPAAVPNTVAPGNPMTAQGNPYVPQWVQPSYGATPGSPNYWPPVPQYAPSPPSNTPYMMNDQWYNATGEPIANVPPGFE